ncbi:Tautomerase/MIF superfamily [Pisolithus sp. B1]|nr:Tautomerase/MIF superfamily [Pisolithus sp. B1]
MPLIWLTTNVKLESDDTFRTFVCDFRRFAAQTIGKDENAFIIDCQYNPFLTCRGGFEPSVLVQTMSLYNTNPENSILWSKAFSDFFEEKLGVPPDRAVLAFLDAGPDFIGMKGTTASVIRANAAKQG